MSDELPLQSFEVYGYRGIRHLTLPRLGHVNLFVGLNNAGKTSLLEAVHLYTSKAPRVVLASILHPLWRRRRHRIRVPLPHV
jgi:recombinational DNA repair ATPase RecF